MKKSIRRLVLDRDGIGLQYIASMVFLGVLLAGVLLALFFNTVSLYQRLQHNTENYADDVTAQLAGNISSRMQMRKTYIRSLADMVAEMPEQAVDRELLERRAAYLGMNEIFVVRADGTTIPEGRDIGELESYLTGHPEVYIKASIFSTAHEEVYYSAPIQRSGRDTELLIGVRSSAMLQQMLQEVDFKDQGLSCIVDSGGTVVVSPSDLHPFQQLDDIFKGRASAQDAEAAERLIADIDARRSGLERFRDIGGEQLMVGYDFLGIGDWVLVTLISADLLSQGTQAHMVRYMLITAVMALVAMLTFAFIGWIYRRSLKRIKDIALVDQLTGGINDHAFRMECERLLKERPQRSYALVFLNVRNFKWFNECFGVGTGDEMLVQIDQILRQSIQDDELVARATGDHFYLLLACADEDAVRQRMDGLMDSLERRMSERLAFDRSQLAQGAYMIRDRKTDLMIMQDRAKVASSYQDENEGCRFYDEALGEKLARDQRLNDAFDHAIFFHQFQLYVQPKVRPGHDRPCGGEVLVRWQHPEYGTLFPGEFIPLFEQNGKICDLDFYMVEETCRLMRQWLDQGRAVPLSVNISRAHLVSGDLAFLDRIYAMKEAYHIPDGWIELELTESLMLDQRQVDLVIAMIDKIRAMGFLCSMDDFGFGYSSLALLKDLNVSTVKLDRQFFLGESERSWLVVRQLIALAHELGMTVVAEGVEDHGQVEQLRRFGCDMIQGYVYARPLSIADFVSWSSGKGSVVQ